MAAVYVFVHVCVPDVFVLCVLRCPTRPTRRKTSAPLQFLRIAARMFTCMCAYVRVCMFVCEFVCVSMAAVYVLVHVCVPDVFLLCLLRCPTRPTRRKTSTPLQFLRIAACMFTCMCAYVRVCMFVCVFVCVSMAAVCMHVCLLCLLKCLLSAYVPLALPGGVSVESATYRIIWIIYTER